MKFYKKLKKSLVVKTQLFLFFCRNIKKIYTFAKNLNKINNRIKNYKKMDTKKAFKIASVIISVLSSILVLMEKEFLKDEQ